MIGIKKKKKKKNKKNPEGVMPFLEHIRELRNKLIVSFISIFVCAIVAFIFYKPIIAILSMPFKELDIIMKEKTLFVNSIYEPFTTRIKVALLGGIVLSLPIHLFNIIKFVFPGLKLKEKKVILYSLVSSFFLIIVSSYYTYFKLIPFSVKFLTGKSFMPENVSVLLNFGKNIFIIFQFLIVALLVFQLPLVLELLMVMNIVTRKALLKASRYIVVGIFILSALVTPPDIVSQAAFALPLVFLFFVTLIIAKIFKFGES